MLFRDNSSNARTQRIVEMDSETAFSLIEVSGCAFFEFLFIAYVTLQSSVGSSFWVTVHGCFFFILTF